MVQRNPHIAKLNAGYLFPEINKRKHALLKRNPDAKIISLGVGDTTQPLVPHVVKRLAQSAIDLGTKKGYSGYGPEQGELLLREKIAHKLYHNCIQPHDIFINDGAKSEVGRLQVLFGHDVTIAVQDPSYPVYVDTSVIMGQTRSYDSKLHHYSGITYMLCSPENGFFPQLEEMPRTDLIYFCSPNNPTGTVATKKQLSQLVSFAKKNRSIIIFDSAYAPYILDQELPRSIYEIPGAKEVAIEVGSFSKMAGFTGVRLGWSIVPDDLLYDDGNPVKNDWHRIHSTFFNNASNIAQQGGIAVLDEKGLEQIKETIDYYLQNTFMIKEALEELGIPTYGGSSAPYIWAAFPGRKSWDVFEEILEKKQIITTPGSGFGPGGEGFVRFSGLARRDEVVEAIKRLQLP